MDAGKRKEIKMKSWKDIDRAIDLAEKATAEEIFKAIEQVCDGYDAIGDSNYMITKGEHKELKKKFGVGVER